MSSEILINSNQREIRVALMENHQVAELFIEHKANKGIVGNIYRGRVTKILPGMQVAFVIDGETGTAVEKEVKPPGPETPTTGPPPRGLSPRYTFSSFVVGSSNQFAHAASVAVAEASPADAVAVNHCLKASNSSFRSSVTTCGLALPRVTFMTCPTRNRMAVSLPLR